jgi:hypothetical protein
MKTLLVVLFSCIVLLPVTIHAELSLQQLANQCEGTEPKPSQPTLGILMCISYIGGALDQIILTDGLSVQSGNQAKRTICGPDQGKVEKLAALVKFAVKENPELLKQPARAVLRGLILSEFKCS